MRYDRAYFFDTYVAGRLYGDADRAWPFLKVGQKVNLVREPDNSNDSSAVAVCVAIEGSTLKLGYIPLRKNLPLALMLDMGWEDAFIATISRLDPSATYDRQIGITVSIIRNDHHEQQ